MLHRFNPPREFSTYHHPPISHNTCQPLHKLIPKTTTTTTKNINSQNFNKKKKKKNKLCISNMEKQTQIWIIKQKLTKKLTQNKKKKKKKSTHYMNWCVVGCGGRWRVAGWGWEAKGHWLGGRRKVTKSVATVPTAVRQARSAATIEIKWSGCEVLSERKRESGKGRKIMWKKKGLKCFKYLTFSHDLYVVTIGYL